MRTYEEIITELVDRAYEKRAVSLYDLIQSEKSLQKYEPGTYTILTGNELSSAVVPCDEYMILTRERYSEQEHRLVSEYAIYRQEDADGHPLIDSLNANATYYPFLIGKETFDNMAAAIAYAYKLITERMVSDDPVKIVASMTDDDPDANLTETDAVHLIAEAVNQGYSVPASLTPELFLQIYNDLRPENGN